MTKRKHPLADDALRIELCEIIYDDYKGATFFLNHMLAEKQAVMTRLADFRDSKAPMLEAVRSDPSFWYPFRDQGPGIPSYFHSEYYVKSNGEPGETHDGEYDYFIDPVKLMFFLACSDISKMDTSFPAAREILAIDAELFSILAGMVGDPECPGGISTIRAMRGHIDRVTADRAKNMADESMDDHYRDLVVRSCDSLLDHTSFLEPMFSVAEALAIESASRDPGRSRSPRGV